jgi:hypothetical protein
MTFMHDNYNRQIVYLLIAAMLLVAFFTTVFIKNTGETYYGQQVDLRLRGLK